MNLFIGERIGGADWSGLPLGRFAPRGQGTAMPVAAAQDTLFLWRDGASAAQVRTRERLLHYERHSRVLDFMARDEEVFITYDTPEVVGECLLVALPPEIQAAYTDCPALAIPSRFAFEDPFVYETACVLEQQCIGHEPWGRLFTESVSAALVSYFVARYGSAPRFPATAPRGSPGRLSTAHQSRILCFIESRLGEDLSLRDLAERIGASPAHFMRLFTRTFAQSPHQFVLNRRIEKAKGLLRLQHHSLAEVSMACGFGSPSHFGVAFRQRTGMTPHQFRMTPPD